ncbi:MAG TPA: FHA domain-containing serine/threonine-protein kinase, partial [Planctomycetaceae bacterium]|nr:FHA domain-containing serine/threonine-protein kinase [Planctomycetaceae bacterium]
AAVERLKLREQPNAREAARALVREGLLTRFQAERLLEGRYRGFFIDQYKVLEILGVGGMACLYLALDLESGQQVALKVLSDRHKTDAGMLARLKLEARAGKKLSHSSLIHTYGIHRTDDVFGEAHYLVMEYVEGINLEELINLHGPVPWQQAADFARQAAAGLHHAHANGMVHRDVKPGNLLVDAEGCIKILDFGLALIDTAEDEEFSLAMIFGHSCLGTADYIAPEQTVDSFAVDARADIYSLGCTLYVALTGKLPFPIASSCQKLEGHRSRPAPPLRGIVPEVPAELAAVVERMMAKRPDERYQTMAEVVEALTPFTRRMPVEFEFHKVLAWRAKEARRRFALHRQRVPGASGISSSAALHGLTSTSTRRLPQATADTEVDKHSRGAEVAVSLIAPFEGAREAVTLSRPELNQYSDNPVPVLAAVEGRARFPLTKDRVVVGRDPQCDVQLALPQISGRHCEFRFDGSHWRVVDLDSKNGVQVNGVTVTNQVVRRGDRVTIARHQFRLEIPSPPAAEGRWLQWGLTAVVAFAVSLTALFLRRFLLG